MFFTAYEGVPLTDNQKIILSRMGANIRRERVAQNLTQEKLAELADLNLRTLQKIESGNLNILVTTAQRLQTALGCPWIKLLNEEKSAKVYK